MVNLLLLACGSFLIGALPIIAALFWIGTGRKLSHLGTGNISVSAAFYHGGTLIGILAVVSEAMKGIAVVWIAHQLYPSDAVAQLFALVCLVSGRFLVARSAGTTNAVWGMVAYNWRVAFFLLLVSGSLFILDRNRDRHKYLVLFLLPLFIAMMVQEVWQTMMAMILGGLLAMIYRQIPDDLDMDSEGTRNQAMFHFLKGQTPQNSLDLVLKASEVGEKAANLSFLKRQGYNVPPGCVLKAGDDPEHFAAKFSPSAESPFVVRSSAVGEDTLQASAAGQYETILNVKSQFQLVRAIARCQDSFDNLSAIAYRQEHHLEDSTLCVLVQPQIQSQYAGVVFSRDPLESWIDQVVIEGVEGQGEQLVSGQKTPFRYSVSYPRTSPPTPQNIRGQDSSIPSSLILELAVLARRLEKSFDGIPQDIEWAYDGQQLWILQSRPITTLHPIWTRKIAAEVIPGLIPPLTWSINQPLTCGVWGEIFSAILGSRKSASYQFSETAELHFGHAYFNASLLGDIFIDMGLPPESLEFLTQGAPMTPPKGLAVFQSLPGLMRLLGKEMKLRRELKQKSPSVQDFLARLEQDSLSQFSTQDLSLRIQNILAVLEEVTYFQIMVPLSVAVRQKILGQQEQNLDLSVLPEVAALQSMQAIAQKIPADVPSTPEAVLNFLKKTSNSSWQTFLKTYGYLSEVATDISVPTWQEQPLLIAQSIQNLRQGELPNVAEKKPASRALRLDLKGQVAEFYNRLLAHLRWSFLALEEYWLEQNILQTSGDIFLLKWSEITQALQQEQSADLETLVSRRRQNYQLLADQEQVPSVIYGQVPEILPEVSSPYLDDQALVLEGIGASAGEIEGQVLILESLGDLPHQLDAEMILVVPFTDAGWAPIFAKAGGIISEVGGRLSHGAILAREYGIPAVMDVQQALSRLKTGQKVRMNGLSGRIEILAS